MTYKYRYEVPKSYKDIKRLDKKNGNTNWIDANKLKHKHLAKYNLLKDRGLFHGCIIPCGYQLIRVHTIFDVKVD